MNLHFGHVYFAATLLQSLHLIISVSEHFGHLNFALPERLVMLFPHEIQLIFAILGGESKGDL